MTSRDMEGWRTIGEGYDGYLESPRGYFWRPAGVPDAMSRPTGKTIMGVIGATFIAVAVVLGCSTDKKEGEKGSSRTTQISRGN